MIKFMNVPSFSVVLRVIFRKTYSKRNDLCKLFTENKHLIRAVKDLINVSNLQNENGQVEPNTPNFLTLCILTFILFHRKVLNLHTRLFVLYNMAATIRHN